MRTRTTQKPKPTALEKAVALLARQEQSSAKLREKLRQRDYAPEEIDAAIARLEERHYLNDEEACARQYQKLYEETGMSVRMRTAENKQSRSEYYEIVEISYDKDGNETGWETIASIW